MAKPKKQSARDLPSAYKEKLKSSGLNIDDALKLGFEVLDSVETAKLDPAFSALLSFKIPYFDFDGKPLSSWPKHPPFYRIRYLEQPVGFDALVADKKMPRYVQPANSGICAYFPRNANWRELLADKDRGLIITEGELKAAKACKEGFKCVGLGGVWNFKSAARGIVFLPELEQIDWVGLNVYFCYDSDMRTNSNICLAMEEMAEEVMMRGAFPFMVSLPPVVKDGKTGLDDFLVAKPADDFRMLLDQATPLTLARPLLELSQKVIYVRNPGIIVDRLTAQKLTPEAFKNHAYATKDSAEFVVKDGDIALKRASPAATWIKWPLRAEAESLTYQPGKERVTGAPAQYNLWSGWACQPKKGDVSLFLKLLDHLFTGSEKGAKEWLLKWLAFPIKYPGVKLITSPAIHGRAQGTGKSLVGYTMKPIYGDNWTELNENNLQSNFNEWAECKQFVLADDVTGSDKRKEADMLKKMISQKSIRINPKYVPSYEVPDCINYIFTSNQPDAFFLEDNDRRFFIHEVKVDPLDEDFYNEYDLWLNSKDIGPAMFHYLLNVDVGDFNPSARAMMTNAKQRMISDVKSDLGSWMQRLIHSPDAVLKFGEVVASGDLFTTRQLLSFYDPTGKSNTKANGVGREARRAGLHQVLDGELVDTKEGKDQFFIVRNINRWMGASRKEVEKYVRGQEHQEPEPEKKPRY